MQDDDDAGKAEVEIPGPIAQRARKSSMIREAWGEEAQKKPLMLRA